ENKQGGAETQISHKPRYNETLGNSDLNPAVKNADVVPTVTNDTIPEVVHTKAGDETAVVDSLKATVLESNVVQDDSTSVKTSGKISEQVPNNTDEASEYESASESDKSQSNLVTDENDKENVSAEKIVNSQSEESEKTVSDSE
ncbi:hypothetical protein A2U01_0054420, partial [Trifolium medium]|nr:hypothetical protein [Trifolium medium]